MNRERYSRGLRRGTQRCRETRESSINLTRDWGIVHVSARGCRVAERGKGTGSRTVSG